MPAMLIRPDAAQGIPADGGMAFSTLVRHHLDEIYWPNIWTHNFFCDTKGIRPLSIPRGVWAGMQGEGMSTGLSRLLTQACPDACATAEPVLREAGVGREGGSRALGVGGAAAVGAGEDVADIAVLTKCEM